MEILVDEIFSRYSNNQEELTFEEWQQWFLNLEGMKEVLDMRPHHSSGNATNTHKGNSSKLHQSSSMRGQSTTSRGGGRDRSHGPSMANGGSGYVGGMNNDRNSSINSGRMN